MTCGDLNRWTRSGVLAGAVVVAFFTTFAGEAGAACFTGVKGQPLVNPLQLAARTAADDQDQNDASIVGLWNSQFLLGDGPDLFDHSFQQFHSDGTEMMLSRGLPPALGNVCVGVWKQTGPRTYKLKHTAWNWNLEGSFVGIFVMEVTLKLDRRGASYTGTWSADNLTPSGEPIPGEHFEGIVRGTRITVD
jgi:hypothetical protein